MKQRLIETKVVVRCHAVVTFRNGMGFTRTTPWHDASHGFDGGHWGVYPHLRDAVGKEIRMMQKDYGAPSASVAYYRQARKVIVTEQVFDSEKFYAEQKVEVPDV